MKNIIKVLMIAVCMLVSGFSASARAATVKIVRGEEVGMTTAYWAGILTIDVDGTKMPAINLTPVAYAWENFTGTLNGTLYTRDDILAGAPVMSTPDKYADAVQFFITGLLGYRTNDPLFAAWSNEWAWNTTLQPWQKPLWYYANQPDPATGTTGMDGYNYLLPRLDHNYNYSGHVEIFSAQNTSAGSVEFLVYTSAVPIPTSVLLFCSGLIGVLGIARKHA